MPITFIISGVLILMILFDFLRFKSNRDRDILFVILCLIFLSFFSKDIVFKCCSFNVLSLFVLVAVLFFAFYSTKLVMGDFVLIVFVSMSYYFLLNLNLSFLLSYNSLIVVLFMLFVSMFYLFSFKKGIVVISISYVLLTLISSYVEIDNFGFSRINFDLFRDLLFCYVIMTLIVNLIVAFSCRLKRRFYVEKMFFVFNGFNNIGNIF